MQKQEIQSPRVAEWAKGEENSYNVTRFEKALHAFTSQLFFEQAVPASASILRSVVDQQVAKKNFLLLIEPTGTETSMYFLASHRALTN